MPEELRWSSSVAPALVWSTTWTWEGAKGDFLLCTCNTAVPQTNLYVVISKHCFFCTWEFCHFVMRCYSHNECYFLRNIVLRTNTAANVS